MTCAACGSEGIVKLSLVHETGMTSTPIGTNITITAAKAAPPKRKSSAGWWFFGLVSLALVAASPWWLLLTAFCLAGILTCVQYNRKTWAALFAKWDTEFMCTRCGVISRPKILRPTNSSAPVIEHVNVTPVANARAALVDTLKKRAEGIGRRNVLMRWKAKPGACDDCVTLASGSPYEHLPTWPGMGDTQCGKDCRCVIVADEDAWNASLRDSS